MSFPFLETSPRTELPPMLKIQVWATLASAGALVDGAAALEAPFRNAGEQLRPTYHHTYNENHTTD